MDKELKSTSQDGEKSLLEMSFEEYEKRQGIKQEPIFDEYEQIAGFHVSKVTGIRWLTEKEEKIMDKYVSRRFKKPISVYINYWLYLTRKRIHLG